MNFKDERRYIGHISQLFDVKEFTYQSGRAKGVRAVEIKNGSGLEFTVLADRNMDIGSLSYKGVNVSFITAAGVVAPEFYDPAGGEWLRNFTGGFLTTCGLSNVGGGCVDEGVALGVHGRIANVPAEEFSVVTDTDGDAPCVTVRGKMHESVIFAENLEETRVITTSYKEPSFTITDTVENLGCRTVPYMHLYHFNFGYPFLNENCEIIIPSREFVGKDQRSEDYKDKHNTVHAPVDAYPEMLFLHTLRCDEKGDTAVAIYNHELGMGAMLEFNVANLDHFIQWYNLGTGEFVMGMEPSNCKPFGRVRAREENDLRFLASGERETTSVKATFFEGAEALCKLRERLSTLK